MAKNKRLISKDKSKGKFDITFFGLVMTILIIGLVMLFSASHSFAMTYYNDSFRFISRQLVFAVGGVVAMLVLSHIDYHIYQKLSIPIFVVAVILLIAVYGFPEIAYVHRWITIGPIQFQPSEIGKLAVIILFAHLISKNQDKMDDFKFIGLLVLLLGVVCALVVFETHVSATILIFAIGVILMFVGGLSNRFIAWGTAALAAVGVGGFFVLKYFLGYASDRISAWLNPWADPSDTGYQTIQSLLAIGSGGILGRGIGQSRQKHLWIPEPHNDFIFSVVCEELGLIGALIIILLFCALVWRGFTIALRAKDKFGTLLAMGLTFQVGLQVALNIMVVTNTIPNTGISLPFFSYGGTALLLLLAQMGIVLSVSRQSSLEKS